MTDSRSTTMRHAAAARPAKGPLVAVAVAAVALAAATAFVPAIRPTAPVADASAVRVTRACPTLDAGVQLGLTALGDGLAQAPLATPTTLTPVTSPQVIALAKDPGRISAPVGSPFWGVVSASAATDADQGLSLAACRSPRAQQWFAGVRSNANARSEVVLVNLDTTEASVNINVYGPDGALAAPGARGVEVAGRSQRILPMGPLVDAATPVTLEVATSTGRVAAFVRQRLFNGTAPLGADWISATAEPDELAVIGSVPAGDGARTLVIGNPGDRTAQVKVEVLGPDGAYAPVGIETVDVPADSTRTFPLDQVLGGKSAALRLTGSRPIVAAVEAATVGDWATLTAHAGVGAKAVVNVPLPGGIAPVVTVANPGAEAAHVEVKITDPSGKVLLEKSQDVLASAALTFEPGPTAGLLLSVVSSSPSLRVSLAATGAVGTVPGIAMVGVADASSPVPAVVVTRDPRLGG
ncbi:MAG TPA: DUF5719 family protein [Propioniciclava tarda]|nr:DUF5719 family protein [Propioniciclava tarda]